MRSEASAAASRPSQATEHREQSNATRTSEICTDAAPKLKLKSMDVTVVDEAIARLGLNDLPGTSTLSSKIGAWTIRRVVGHVRRLLYGNSPLLTLLLQGLCQGNPCYSIINIEMSPHSVSFELVAGFFWIQVKCHTAPRASCSRPNRRSSSKKKLHHTKMLSVFQFSIAVRACQSSEQANVAPLDDRVDFVSLGCCADLASDACWVLEF